MKFFSSGISGLIAKYAILMYGKGGKITRNDCPCDIDGICPYNAQYSGDCEYWCHYLDEPDDTPDLSNEDLEELYSC